MRLRDDLVAYRDLCPIVDFVLSNDSTMGQIALNPKYDWNNLRSVLDEADNLLVSADREQKIDKKEELARIEWVQASIWVYVLLIYAAERSVLGIKSDQHQFALSVFRAIVASRGFPTSELPPAREHELHKTALLLAPQLSSSRAPKHSYQKVRALAIELERELTS